jgi:Leucine-rich repeat (LRR) protein
MKMKKLMLFVMSFMLVLSITSCVNTYKRGVDYSDFPDKDIPIYDDAVVYYFESDDEESELSYGTTDDIDDIVEFYQDEFDDSDYIITKEKEDKDEYEIEGYIGNTHFEIEAEEARRDEGEYFDYVVTISIEQVDDEEIEEIEASMVNDMVIISGSDGQIILQNLSGLYSDTNTRVYLDGKKFQEGSDISFDGSALSEKPHNLVIEILDSENNEIIFTETMNSIMYYNASEDETLIYIPDTYKQAEGLIIDFEYGAVDLSAIYEVTSLKYLSLTECGQNTDINGISANTNLEYLVLDGDSFNNTDSLSSLKRIDTLVLSGGFDEIEFLSDLDKITSAALQGSFSDLSPISKLRQMRNLYLSANAIDLSPISMLNKLKMFEYWGDYTDISALENLTDLEYLEIGGDFSDISPLRKLTKLKYLSLWGEYEDISALSDLNNIEYMELNGDFSDISALASMENLKSAYISGLPGYDIDTTVLDELGVEYKVD